MYYLQSRYYDPETGRFINADRFVATGQGFIGNNMFAYCNNNPVVFVDPAGYCKEVGALLTWIDCGDHNCPTSSLYQPGRYTGGYNHPKNNYHLNSEPYWESRAKSQDQITLAIDERAKADIKFGFDLGIEFVLLAGNIVLLLTPELFSSILGCAEVVRRADIILDMVIEYSE